jgi:tritrans,polycis-undecaprenyl-diphosphate synthase [geranylgeranyl-diphosphate specific]
MKLPKHVAFILDGNRRFGEIVLNDRLAGHKYGADKIKDILDWCHEYDIKTVTLWGFSTENFNRPKEEVDMLMNLFIDKLSFLIKKKSDIHKHEVRINFYGKTDLFPQKVQTAINKVIEATKNYDKYVVNFAIGYGGHQEILDVVKKLAERVAAGELLSEDISKEDFESALYIDLPNIDLIIRTGGARRTSGFMPWKGAYAEWYFTEKYWPEFDKHEFLRALTDYSDRQRRFGK